MILPKFCETLSVFCEILSYKYFRELNFAKFRQLLSFAKEISRNFVKYFFLKTILLKFREILQNSFLNS